MDDDEQVEDALARVDAAREETGATLSPPEQGTPRVRGHVMVLGDALVRSGHITPAQLQTALEGHRRGGERLGRVLLSLGMVSRQDLHRALAGLWNLPFVDLLTERVDASVARRFDPAVLAEQDWLPYRCDGGVVWVATAEPPDAAVVDQVRAEFGDVDVAFAVTTDWDIDVALRRVFSEQLADRAANALFHADPMLSARHGLVLGQKVALASLVLVVLAGAVLAGGRLLTTVMIGANLMFTAAITFKMVTALVGWRAVRRGAVDEGEHRIPDDELPVYTVLVPVFHEANVVGGLIRHLRDLDYPQEKLEVLLLMEEEDTETIEAARAARPPDTVRFVIVPAGRPQTKPRACNLGLLFCRGEYLVIYDAEDLPERSQLRQAVAAFRAGGDRLACVQARLNYFNSGENLLTRMFTLEYSWWFDYMLPGLDRLRLPIPLGGTSNHFRTAVLRELGGWDAWNVTEDADLGLRAGAKGYRVGVIPSTTFEEACGRYRPWIRQRTRWIKGYMQTTLVYTRQPVGASAAGRLRSLLGLALLIAGTPLAFLVAPLMWAITIATYVPGVWGAAPVDLLPGPIELIALLNLVVGNVVMVLLNALAVARRRMWRLLPFALLNPLYWVLHSIAAWRALHQLIRNPFLWEKTPHGLTSHTPQVTPEPVSPPR